MGQTIKYHHDVIGCNSRLDTLQAALLQIKLKHLDRYINARQQVAQAYNHAFAALSGVTCPVKKDYSSHTFHQYTLKIENRNKVKEELAKMGIPSMIYYPVPLHKQKAYKQFAKQDFAISNKLCDQVLSLPIHTEMKEQELKQIIESFTKVITGYQ